VRAIEVRPPPAARGWGGRAQTGPGVQVRAREGSRAARRAPRDTPHGPSLQYPLPQVLSNGESRPRRARATRVRRARHRGRARELGARARCRCARARAAARDQGVGGHVPEQGVVSTQAGAWMARAGPGARGRA